MQSIRHYIKTFKNSGYSDEVIIEEFKNKGYDEAMIKQELHSFKSQQKHVPTNTERHISMLGAGCVVLFMIWIMSKTQSTPSQVLIGFLPAICTVIITLILIEQLPTRFKVYLWVLPLATSAVFYVVALYATTLHERMDIGSVTMLNFIVGMLYVFLISFLMQRPFELPAARLERQDTKKHEAPKKAKIEESIQVLEDKLKALNFAIGRVYRRSNGGTTEMRDKIKIPAEIYNFFSQITAEHAQQYPEQVKGILVDLQEKLKILEKTEKEVFGKEISGLQNIKRHWDGSSKILDVIAWNDDDPVKSYFASAQQYCRQAIDELEAIAKK